MKAKHKLTTLNIIYYKTCGNMSNNFERKIQTIYLMNAENSIVDTREKRFQ